MLQRQPHTNLQASDCCALDYSSSDCSSSSSDPRHDLSFIFACWSLSSPAALTLLLAFDLRQANASARIYRLSSPAGLLSSPAALILLLSCDPRQLTLVPGFMILTFCHNCKIFESCQPFTLPVVAPLVVAQCYRVTTIYE
jgi:hypothetical protein